MINSFLLKILLQLLSTRFRAQIALAPLSIESEEEIYDDWKCMKGR